MRPQSRSARKQKTGLYILIGMVAVLMALSVVLIIVFPEEDFVRPSSVSGEIFSQTDGFTCDLSEAKKLYPLGNGLLKLGRDRVSYLDLNGTEKFGETIEMNTPVCQINGEYALVMDTAGTYFALLSPDGLIYSGQAPYTIDFGSVNKQGYVSIIFDKPGIKGAVRFIKPDGQTLFEWESVESGYIVSACVSPSSERIDTSVYNTDSSQPFPMLKRFSPEGDAVAQFFPETEELLPLILYDMAEEPVLCGITDLIKSGNEGYDLVFSKVLSAVSSDHGIVIAARKEAEDLPMLYKVSDEGAVSAGIVISDEVTGISVRNGTAAIGLVNSVVFTDIEQMKVVSRIPVGSSLIRSGFNKEGNKLIIVSGEGVMVYKVSD